MSRGDAVIEVTRGGRVESRHQVSAALVDERGELRAWLGDPELLAFFRSAAKPVQALAIVADGAADAYDLSDAEIAVCCASHSGEPAHVEAVRSVLDKIGCSEDDLVCGPHWPFHKDAAEELRGAGASPGRIHNNCSGKHAAMLAWSRHEGVDTTDYHHVDHPVQRRICSEIASWAGSTCEAMPVGVDGCGVPSFAQPLNVMAGVYASIVAAAERDPASAAARLTRAMTNEPYFVGGTGRLTSRLMQVTGGRLLAKFGAEAVYCLGDRDRGWGVAVKVEDGHRRAVGPAVIEFIAQMEMLTADELEALQDRHTLPVRNTRDEIVGEIRPNFRVERSA
ncbi:MAG: asparaginase [Gemmatimonadota bacterium]|nr:MAG: asparaginase [Gemmatimonadota bacterium]